MTVDEHVSAVTQAAKSLREAVEGLESELLTISASKPSASSFASTALANVQRMLTAATGSFHLAVTGGTVILNMTRAIESGGDPGHTHTH